jgi:hypothetical protein
MWSGRPLAQPYRTLDHIGMADNPCARVALRHFALPFLGLLVLLAAACAERERERLILASTSRRRTRGSSMC